MRFTKKTEYGLICLVHMARLNGKRPIPLKELVIDEHYSLPFTEKIFQKLRAARIVQSQQGNQGGYALARPASKITLKEIIEALEGQTFDIFCHSENRRDVVCSHFPLCGVKPIWEKTKSLIDEYYDSLTLAMLAEGNLGLESKLPPQGHKNGRKRS
ncbi:MAG: Rrf2 family transcriptional regulator [Candidatus Omnitrophica bacterium]|nr:Rrf2 family transcriptional regulator [Candidatus Omnitrophota bacterium]